MCHIVYFTLMKTSAQSYDYTITLFKREKKVISFENWMFLICENLHFLHLRMLCVKFDWNWPSASGKEDENVKWLQKDGQTVVRGGCCKTDLNHVGPQFGWFVHIGMPTNIYVFKGSPKRFLYNICPSNRTIALFTYIFPQW